MTCMHEGIDPFDIFERKISSSKYRGHDRPDMPNEPDDTRKVVHAYPAWHTAIFWWYGYMPKWLCLTFLICLYVCSLAWVCKWTSQKLTCTNAKDCTINIMFLMAMTLYSWVGICHSMNYGLLLLACTMLLYTAIDSGHNLLAGIIYSFIMIKPQIGVLLIFPLLFNRKYKTIALAVAICLIETCITSFLLNKSPIELIFQIPKIGAPFEKGFLAEKTMQIVGPVGQYIVMGLFVCLAASGSYLVRNAKESWIRFLPAIAFIPFWTYSQSHDWLVVLPCYIYILNSKHKYPRMTNLCFIIVIFRAFIVFSHFQGWYSIGKEGVAVVLRLFLFLSCFLMVIFDTDKNKNKTIHNFFNKLSSLGEKNN